MSAKTPRADAQKPDEQMIQEVPKLSALSALASRWATMIANGEQEIASLRCRQKIAADERIALLDRIQANNERRDYSELAELQRRAWAAEAEADRFSGLASQAEINLRGPRRELADQIALDSRAKAWQSHA